MKLVPSPTLKLTIEGQGRVDPILFELLRHLQVDGRLTTAAKDVGISYRHAWNIIRKWNKVFGQPVVSHHRGHGTELSPLGKKLVWAEQLIEAHLGPQITSLGSTISRELDEVLGNPNTSLRIYASHGYAISLVHELLEHERGYVVDIKYTDSVAALDALNKRQCEIAGFHVPLHPALKRRARNVYKSYLNHKNHVVIRMVIRSQGLIVQKGNPKQIRFLTDLFKPGIRFINRQKSAGTRVLFDSLLHLCGLDGHELAGYAQEEFTHSAVAAHVASGSVDVGFGIEYAAQKFNLDFIPIVNEQYVLACEKAWLQSDAGRELVQLLRSHHFVNGIGHLPGYRLDAAGETIEIAKLLQAGS